MKTANLSERFRLFGERSSPLLPVAIGMGLLLGSPVGSRAGTTNSTAASAASPSHVTASKQGSSQARSEGVDDILKLADAGITTEVIKAYVECSAPIIQLTAADIIALKSHDVADEIIILMVKRDAEARAAVNRVRQDDLAVKLESRRRAAGGWDPEGYDYFQYHYLQPRALASGYQRLAPYYYHPFSYGYRYPFRR